MNDGFCITDTCFAEYMSAFFDGLQVIVYFAAFDASQVFRMCLFIDFIVEVFDPFIKV